MVRVATRIFLLLVVLCAPLTAGPETMFQIGIVSMDGQNPDLSDLVLHTANRYGSNLFLSPSHLQLLEMREVREAKQRWEEEVHAAYEKQDLQALQKLNKEGYPVPELYLGSSLPVSYTAIAIDERIFSALSKSHEARTWLLSKETLDGLFLVKTELLDQFERVRIEFFALNQQEPQLLLDRLVESRRYQALAKPLGEALFSFASQGKQSALVLSDELLRFSWEVDGKKQESKDGLLFLSPGTHELRFSSASYEPIVVQVDLGMGTVETLEVSLKPLAHPPLVLHALSGRGTWTLEGKALGQSANLSLSLPSYPLMLTYEKEGFSKRIIQLERPVDTSLSFSSLAMELDDPLLVKDAQKDFYKRLRNTILLFGAYVGSLALSKTFAVDNPLWQVGMIGTSSVALVSGMALVMEMARYASWAGTH